MSVSGGCVLSRLLCKMEETQANLKEFVAMSRFGIKATDNNLYF